MAVATAEATTEQSVALGVGDVWEIGVITLDDEYDGVAATVAVTVTDPDGDVTTPAVSADTDTGIGYYTTTVTLDVAGRWLAVAAVSGAVVAVVPYTCWASEPTTAAGMPDLAAVKAYLGDTSWTDAEITSALTAETAAQQARCRIPATYGPDLAEALKRRVARNLAARAVPLATYTSFEGGGGTSTKVPWTDPEIRRLESRYRRWAVG